MSIKTPKFLLKCMAMLLMLPLLWLSSLSAQQNNFDRLQMQRDLNIMEGILDQLLQPQSHGNVRGLSKGVYLPGYGVLFQASFASGIRQVFFIGEDGAPLPPSPAPEIPGGIQFSTEDSLGRRASLEILKTHLTTFLGSYAGSIGQLQKNDRVSVVVNIGRNFSIGIPLPEIALAPGSSRKPGIAYLSAGVSMESINRYRRQELSDKNFRKEISIHEHPQGEPAFKSLEIFSSIINRSIRFEDSPENGLISRASQNARGAYIKGLGAVFFVTAFRNNPVEFHDLEVIVEQLKNQPETVIRREKRNPGRQGDKIPISRYKDTLIEVLANFGHTLNEVGNKESLILILDFNDRPGGRSASAERMVLSVVKEKITRAGPGNVSALKQHVRVEEF